MDDLVARVTTRPNGCVPDKRRLCPRYKTVRLRARIKVIRRAWGEVERAALREDGLGVDWEFLCVRLAGPQHIGERIRGRSEQYERKLDRLDALPGAFRRHRMECCCLVHGGWAKIASGSRYLTAWMDQKVAVAAEERTLTITMGAPRWVVPPHGLPAL
jgi:hypothetical protein